MARLFAFLFYMVLVVPVSAVCAQEVAAPDAFDEQSAKWDRNFERIEAYVQGSEHLRPQHAEFNAQLEKIKNEAQALEADAQQEMTAYTRLLEALGPPPGEGDPPESTEIQMKREDLNARINVFRSRMAQADLTTARAEELEEALSALVRADFRERMLIRGALPLAPNTVTTAVPEFFTVVSTLTHSYSEWRSGLSDHQLKEVRWRGMVVLLVLPVAWGIRRFLLKCYGRDVTIKEPSYTRRFVAAVAEGVARGIVPASLFAVPLVLIPLGLSVATGLFGNVVSALCAALILLILGLAMTRAVLAPDLPAWRCTRMAPAAARVLSRRIIFLIAVFAVDVFFDRAVCLECEARYVYISDELESLYSLIIDSLEAIGILLVVQGWLWRTVLRTEIGLEAGVERATETHAQSAPVDQPAETPTEPVGGRVWRFVRRLVGVTAVIGVAANLIGYVNLGDRMIDGLMLSGAILGGLYLIRRFLRELMRFGLASNAISGRLGLGENSRDLVCFWLGIALDLVLLFVASYAVLPIWGMPRTDLTRGIADILSGFTIGGVTISFVDILTALLVFVIAVAVTRLIRQTLSEKVLAKTKLDTGIRNSLASGVSYIGITIAALLAVGVMGFNFQNVAIIAGALSVGIGFGLQNIVNNFVSGLILLVERPIKIGDWVVVGEHQGFVKRISVRATEIETFDRASVILPNSELLSTAVMNWTHKDKIGRLIIMVGVAYGCDTERVREILLSCSKDHPEILSWPQPFVLFQNFGGSSLDFELRAYLRDVGSRLTVSSELRFAIDKAFREEGIEIPFSQHDIHLRDIERLEQALAALKPEKKSTASDAAPPRGPVEPSGA